MIQIQVDDGVTLGLSIWTENLLVSFKNDIVMLFTCLYTIHVIFLKYKHMKKLFFLCIVWYKASTDKIWCFIFLNSLQIRYQKEIDRLIKENKDLRKSLMLKEPKSGRKRTMRVCQASHSMQISFYCSHLYQYKNPFNIIVVPPLDAWKYPCNFLISLKMLWYTWVYMYIFCKLNEKYVSITLVPMSDSYTFLLSFNCLTYACIYHYAHNSINDTDQIWLHWFLFCSDWLHAGVWTCFTVFLVSEEPDRHVFGCAWWVRTLRFQLQHTGQPTQGKFKDRENKCHLWVSMVETLFL